MLSEHHLEAFTAVAETAGFTRAAKRLGLSQSALSQRIANLESALEQTLFVRRRGGITLTEPGERLLAYCKTREQLEADLLTDLRPAAHSELSGTLRIAGYSTVVRSIVIPALRSLVADHPKVALHLASREVGELPRLLRSGEAELILLDRALDLPRTDAIALGDERYVLVEATGSIARDAYLDHDPDDMLTHAFLRAQSPRPKRADRITRLFVDDIYGILEGVAAGWGRAVVPEHLLPYKGVRIVPRQRPLRHPVVLHRRSQPFYSALHRAAVTALETAFAKRLG